jgi:hypothetical protein
VKSITTAPFESRKATGIVPEAGGFSELAVLVPLFSSPGTEAGPELRAKSPTVENGIAAMQPNAAALFNNSLLFME